jgi:hypothetical protein
MANLEVIVHSINSFVVTISNISDQTNLLALNLQFKRLELGMLVAGSLLWQMKWEVWQLIPVGLQKR